MEGDKLKEALRRIWNRARIWVKRHLTGKVRVIRLEDGDGNEIGTSTVEQSVEHSCPHERIRLVYGTFWRCMDCEFAFFEITRRVGLSEGDVVGLLEAMAREVRTSVNYVEGEDGGDAD